MFKKILFPIDIQEGELSHSLVGRALGEIRTQGGSLYLMYVLPGFGMPLVASYFPDGAAKAILAQAEGHLRDYIKANIHEDIAVTPIVCEGTPYRRILAVAEEHDIDLILMPHRDRGGYEKWLLGSTAMKVIEHANCSVLLLRDSPAA